MKRDSSHATLSLINHLIEIISPLNHIITLCLWRSLYIPVYTWYTHNLPTSPVLLIITKWLFPPRTTTIAPHRSNLHTIYRPNDPLAKRSYHFFPSRTRVAIIVSRVFRGSRESSSLTGCCILFYPGRISRRYIQGEGGKTAPRPGHVARNFSFSLSLSRHLASINLTGYTGILTGDVNHL